MKVMVAQEGEEPTTSLVLFTGSVEFVDGQVVGEATGATSLADALKTPPVAPSANLHGRQNRW